MGTRTEQVSGRDRGGALAVHSVTEDAETRVIRRIAPGAGQTGAWESTATATTTGLVSGFSTCPQSARDASLSGRYATRLRVGQHYLTFPDWCSKIRQARSWV